MEKRETTAYCLNALLKAGAEQAETVLYNTERTELNYENGEINLIRTTVDTKLQLSVIKQQKLGKIILNQVSPQAITQAIEEVMTITEGAKPDPAHAFAEAQPAQNFTKGATTPDLDLMYQRLKTFTQTVAAQFPQTFLRNIYLNFTRSNSSFRNSNGVDFTTQKGIYHVSATFSAQDGEASSSFNYTGYSTLDLNQELLEGGSLRLLLQNSSRELHPIPLSGKFTGEIILTPDCLEGFISSLLGISITDAPLITGTSIFKDQLNQLVTSPLFTLYSRPVSPEIASGYFFTSDGYAAQNSTIIEQGVLRTYLLSLYGSRKTGLPKAVNDGGAYVVAPGEESLNTMIKGVKRGILLTRFSGGRPNRNGDFSGVAKNSFYLEDGEIKHPLTETMIAGNLAALFRNITAVSQERVNFGHGIYPWIASTGVTISGQ
ncbi:MAG: TldD/PmbA family protein [Firmicutes bacterium]|nr:TldD/PmbA family protein [Bacillota bacterium]